MRAVAVLFIVLSLTATGAFAEPVPDRIWDGRLWLTSQAFALPQDCPVRVLFQDPSFRSVPLAEGGAVTSRLAGQRLIGGDLFLTVETTRQDRLVERVVLQLRAHPADSVVSVESIRLVGGRDGSSAVSDERMLTYADAASDDDDYDVYTDTLVSLYRTFFDEKAVRQRLSYAP